MPISERVQAEAAKSPLAVETVPIAVSPAEIRKTIAKLAYETGIGHIPSCFSIVEILVVLYERFLRVNPREPNWPERDYFILSKGHAAAAIFAVLGHAGYFPLEELYTTYGTFGSRFGCHPDRKKVPGIEASTGSLGHGLPFGIGQALGLKMRGKKNRVAVLIGDGEANEGSIWESAMIAAHQRLDRVIGIMDFNHSTSRCLPVTEPAKKWDAFGWRTLEVDGHSVVELERALHSCAESDGGAPSMIVAHTVKGKGVSFLEADQFAWHHRSPTQDEYRMMLTELDGS